ncbi:Lysosomal & prostatic acid phosphatase, partial [Pseudoloma neurophilia]
RFLEDTHDSEKDDLEKDDSEKHDLEEDIYKDSSKDLEKVDSEKDDSEKDDSEKDIQDSSKDSERDIQDSKKDSKKYDSESIFGHKFDFVIPSNEKESLIGYKTCPRLTHILTLSSKKGFKEFSDKKDIQIITDNFLYSICTKSKINCDKIPCNLEKSIKIVEGSFKTWSYQSILLKKHSNLRKFMFGKFANDLLIILRNNKKINIISAHDNSLSYILTGLGTDILERPPLASAIFIEIWSYNSVKYIRILFNNFVCLTNLDKSTNVPYETMINYLERAAISDEKELEQSCANL